MRQQPSRRSGALDSVSVDGPDEIGTTDHNLARRFIWEIAAIAVYLQEMRNLWAKAVGVSGPQWMIILALAELDQDQGVPVNIVAKMLHVDSSFVTTQSKILEKNGFLRRRASQEDARVVQMSLTDKSYKHIAGLSDQQEEVDNFIFGELEHRDFDDLTSKLSSLKKRFEKARLKMALNMS
jgi:DNA-binding MarR family transcriptional regulator